MRVYVLLYKVDADNEGIHTLQSGGRNQVLMFESEDDATRYGLMLEAQDFPSPTVEAVDSEEIEAFCRDAGYECKLVKSDKLELPPQINVDKTDWMTEDEPEETAEETPEVDTSDLDRIRNQLEGLL